MSTSALPPSPPTTLAIILGASAWPNSPGFQASKAFMHAAHGFRDYLLDPRGFGLPAANLLDLFDNSSGASDQLEQLNSLLQQQSQTLIRAKEEVHDVLVYFVGHGSFVGSSHDFYLMPRRANASSLRATGLSIDALAEVLRERARQARRYLFLDCCFAAAAFRSFQGGPDQIAIEKTLEAFTVRTRSHGFPGKGTVLLCSSDQHSPSLLLPDESCTMFSCALLDILRNGDLHRPHPMSLRDLKELTEDRLVALSEKDAPRPGLYSPDQSEGDVADVPLFPNLRVEKAKRRPISAKLINKSLVTLLSLALVVVLTVVILIGIAYQASISTFNANATRTALDCSTDASHLMAAIVTDAMVDFQSSQDIASSINPEKAELRTLQSGLPVTPLGPVRNECQAAAVSTVDTNIVNREAVTRPQAPINSNLPYAVDAYVGHLLAGYARNNSVPGRVKSDVGPNG